MYNKKGEIGIIKTLALLQFLKDCQKGCNTGTKAKMVRGKGEIH